MKMSWQKAYVAFSVLLEGSPELGLSALSDADRGAASTLMLELSHESRAVRARALATELAIVARALDAQDLGAS
jgi:hypothetical protein